MGATIDRLSVPGASLYYEVRGSGPTLLIVPSGNGDATPFAPLAQLLSDRYQVITYDRRGFSRSELNGPVEDCHRLDEDAADGRRLLEHLADGPAAVFGSSSGGIVALALLANHPEYVHTVVSHEPPLASVLPDADYWIDFYAEVYERFRASGVEAAQRAFRAGMGMERTTRPPRQTELPPKEREELLARIKRNHVFWFEHELRGYPAYLPDTARLRTLSDKLVLACSDTAREALPYRPNAVLAELLAKSIIHLPGGHVGYVTHPSEFASALDGILRRTA